MGGLDIIIQRGRLLQLYLLVYKGSNLRDLTVEDNVVNVLYQYSRNPNTFVIAALYVMLYRRRNTSCLILQSTA